MEFRATDRKNTGTMNRTLLPAFKDLKKKKNEEQKPAQEDKES